MPITIAIDGPAGAGKSTIAKMVSKKIGAIYVDTGAMYRAMALYMIRLGVSPDDYRLVEDNCKNADITIAFEDGIQVVYLNGENVNSLIRTEEVGNMASSVSVNACVRSKLVELQQKLAEKSDVVMDGRDIGTVVLPNANPKIYLTAGTRVRAKRRFDELKEKGIVADLDQIEKDIIERDYRDMHRDLSPLTKANDATEIDSSDMTPDEVAEKIISLIP